MLKEKEMESFTIEPLSPKILEESGWNARWSGLWGQANIREDMMSRDITIPKSNRYHIYTTSQLMELFSKRGDAILKVGGRQDVVLVKDQLNEIGVTLSTIGRNEEFQIVVKGYGPLTHDEGINGKTMRVDIAVCNFIKLSANSIKSKSNLGRLFVAWNVPMFASQRRSLGLDLK